MTRFGYTLMTEQNGPKDLVQYAISAEHRGFDFEVASDHFSPWLTSQGHAPNAWTVLGAVAQVTDRADLYTYVTCPTMRYHPAIVAQQAATVQARNHDLEPAGTFNVDRAVAQASVDEFDALVLPGGSRSSGILRPSYRPTRASPARS